MKGECLLAICMVLTLSVAQVHASGFEGDYRVGWQEGHGGDAVAASFVGIGNALLIRIKSADPALLPSERFPNQFELLLESAKVNSARRVFLGDIEVDAVNFPNESPPRIVINRERWLDPRVTSEERSVLVLHEYLSLLGLDDSVYQLSLPLFQELALQRGSVK